jgi:hypothetical protein
MCRRINVVLKNSLQPVQEDRKESMPIATTAEPANAKMIYTNGRAFECDFSKAVIFYTCSIAGSFVPAPTRFSVYFRNA